MEAILRRIKLPIIALISSILLGTFSIDTAYGDEQIFIPRELRLGQNPANDLQTPDGKKIDSAQARTLRSRGVDISEFDPYLEPSTLGPWINESLPLSESEITFPESQNDLPAEVKFESFYESGDTGHLHRARVSSNRNFYSLKMSLDVHPALMRAALLRKLGYRVSLPKYYSKLKVVFDSIEKRTEFMNALGNTTLTDTSKKYNGRPRWYTQMPDNEPWVILQDLVLENADQDAPEFHWGVIPASRFRGRRAIRGLVVPYALINVPEDSINLYSAQVGQIYSNNVVFTHPQGKNFVEVTYDDALWAVKRLAKLTREELVEVVNYAGYPDDARRLMIQKVVARRNDLLRLFNLKLENYRYNPSITINRVVNGKFTEQWVDGYAQRFSIGDPENPLPPSEIFSLLGVHAASFGISKILNEVNKRLQILTADDAIEKNRKSVLSDIQNSINQNQNSSGAQSVSIPITAFSGPIVGANVSADRSVVHGTYYGSDSPIQKVDTFSIQANFGYFVGVSGLENISPTFSANTVIQRNYTRVKPIKKAETALKKKWDEMILPDFMNGLAKVLSHGKKKKVDSSDEENTESQTEEISLEEEQLNSQKNLSEFLETLEVGEIFTITDSLVFGAQLGVAVPVTAILGLAPVGVRNGVSFGAGKNLVILRRTTLIKTEEGLQVYLQSARTDTLSFDINVYYWMKLLEFSHKVNKGHALTKAYLLNTKFSGDDADQKVKDLLKSLQGILRYNNSQELISHYEPYHFTTRFSGLIDQIGIPVLKWANYIEQHRIRVVSPPNEELPDLNPEDEAREFYVIKKVSRVGKNFFSFFSDLVEGLFKGNSIDKGSSGSNPAYSFMGNAEWQSIRTEGETTKGEVSEPITVVEEHWAGWKMSKSSLFKIMSKIESKFRGTSFQKKLFNRDAFQSMTEIDLYDLSANLMIYESGIQRLIDAIGYYDGQIVNVTGPIDQEDGIAMINSTQARIFGPQWAYRQMVDIWGTRSNRKESNMSMWLRTVGSTSSQPGGYGSSYEYREDRPLWIQINEGMRKLMWKYNDEGNLAELNRIKELMMNNKRSELYQIFKKNYRYIVSTGAHPATYYQIESIPNWMSQILNLRKTRNQGSAEARIRWMNSVVEILLKNVGVAQLLEWLGEDAFFYQVTLNGFRVDDENGDKRYLSETIGSLHPEDPDKRTGGTGALNEFFESHGFSSHTIYQQFGLGN